MEGCQKTLTFQRVYLLFWSIFSLSEGPQAAGYDGARGTQAATFLLLLLPPAQHLPGSSGSPEKPKPALTASTQAAKQAQLWPSNTAWRNHGSRKGADKHTVHSQDCDPTQAAPAESQSSGSSCTATPSRAPARAAALSAWPQHQLLPLPRLSGTPSVPRGDCY